MQFRMLAKICSAVGNIGKVCGRILASNFHAGYL